ncbi:MAG: STAS domain-containing protein [Planctomycetota bacterium]|jgi:anti-anti-sigma factor|nr:STAS domain-containing protein [Planctomycetota bacterium]
MNENLNFTVDAAPNFKVESRVLAGGVPLVKITGRMMGDAVLDTTGAMFDQFAAVTTNLFCDLSECRFLSSMAYSFIYQLSMQRQEKGKKMVLIAADPQVCKVIALTGMENDFAFVATLDAAQEIE